MKLKKACHLQASTGAAPQVRLRQSHFNQKCLLLHDAAQRLSGASAASVEMPALRVFPAQSEL